MKFKSLLKLFNPQGSLPYFQKANAADGSKLYRKQKKKIKVENHVKLKLTELTSSFYLNATI